MRSILATYSFINTLKAVILIAIFIVLCLQNKTFVDRVQKHFGSGNCCGKCTKYLADPIAVFLFHHLPDFFFGHNITFYHIKKCQVHFITLF